MVALLHPDTLSPNTHSPRTLSPRTQTPNSRPHLRVIEGGGVSDSRPLNSLAMGAAAVLVMLFVLFRLIQGAPPASSWEGLADVAYDTNSGSQSAASAPGPVLVDAEQTRIIVEGDTLWAIALELAPDSDPQVVVGRLAARNGGTQLQVGQLLIIPAELS